MFYTYNVFMGQTACKLLPFGLVPVIIPYNFNAATLTLFTSVRVTQKAMKTSALNFFFLKVDSDVLHQFSQTNELN